MKNPCATKGCPNSHTPRSSWCAGCRASLYRWLGMSVAERNASIHRASMRWSRVWAFRGRTGRRKSNAA